MNLGDPRLVQRAHLEGAHEELARVWAVLAPAFTTDEARALCEATLAARDEWTAAFHGEQFSLGRAFYTHDEEGLATAYFAGQAESDARVERILPGMQARMRQLLGAAIGAEVVPRARWCGAGVHVFPAGGKVAREGGVVHADLDGLSRHHRARGLPAVSLVVMLSAMERGGGLRLWERRVLPAMEHDVDPQRSARARLVYAPGQAALVDSYRFHQIEPFADPWDRVSITLHAARTEAGTWESWF